MWAVISNSVFLSCSLRPSLAGDFSIETFHGTLRDSAGRATCHPRDRSDYCSPLTLSNLTMNR